ncbi:MAG TPA: hypothetical protein VET85_10610 [Stellaceae bacterium]|nr:hypothetical protein [Stellaceae bacterium]
MPWVPLLWRAERALWRTLMKFREPASKKSGKKAGVKQMAMTSAAPKRIAATNKSAPSKKPPVKKTAAALKKAVPAKKAPPSPKQAPKKAAAAVKKGAPPVKAPPPAAKPVPPVAAPRLATPIASEPQPQATVAAPAPKPAMPPARPAASAQSEAERRKAVTRKFFARLRSLEAIIGADLRKRGSVVLMQAVDQWYSEAISATATDISITNAAKVVIAHL